ncbi:lipopolysaccharide biosynthesis protein [Paenibacillus aceris]|uniref:O-antigen/teichoic acid export membrane protein n=1 Tax=Paenibacillus aceris TaxID=869555 RepID=A0ABS4HVB4_9BACL|nr:oligosaccharide flippase family protein [Paenibacillus aceris]MBP1962306.1 O-antigen/teichoic acid export membrane protein [Paenibacillus aceris]NHW37129.1 oligosaccharide flippase family protein [Paenibacillus aceris]
MIKHGELLKNTFVKSVLLITGGTVLAQVINYLVSPIITRLYLPEEYGVLAAYAAVIGMLSVLGSLRYESSIAIAENENVAINMVAVSIIILLSITIIISIILAFVSQPLLQLLGLDILYKYKLFISFGLFFIGLYNIFIQLAYRERDFKTISNTKLSQSIVQNTLNIFLGSFGFGSVGLIVGKIAGQSAGMVSLSKPILKRTTLEKISKKEMLWGVKRYKNFPLFSTPSQFLNAAGIQLPLFFLTAFFGTQVTGLYGLATTVINMPVTLIGNSISDVFYSEAANIGKRDPQKLKSLSRILLKKLFLIGIIPMCIVLLLGPSLFSLAFGDMWRDAGVYAQLISISVFSRLVFMPISRVYEVFERQKEAFFLDTARLVLVLFAFAISKILLLNSFWTVGIYSSALSLVYFNTFLMSQKILNDEIKKKSSGKS